MNHAAKLVAIVLVALAAASVFHAIDVGRTAGVELVAPTAVALERHYGGTERALRAIGEGLE